MEVKILTNNYDTDLWCIECKQRIHIGEKFGVIYDEDVYGKFEKCYHAECLPEESEEI
jgi:hypothetical protein